MRNRKSKGKMKGLVALEWLGLARPRAASAEVFVLSPESLPLGWSIADEGRAHHGADQNKQVQPSP